MRIIRTDMLDPSDLKPWEREQCYNGLDTLITAEVLHALLPQLDDRTSATYSFSRSLQGPVLEMRCRGVLVDRHRKSEVIEAYLEKLDRLEEQLRRIVGEGCGLWDFNWRSNRDLQVLFYDILQIPVMRKAGRPTVDREALERMELYAIAKQIVKHIILMRDLGKRIGTLRTDIDKDGRWRTSYNIAGTNTGRFSSSMSEFGTGSNLQNIEDLLRQVFIADPGYKMGYFDAEQGESRVVGAIEWNLFKDGKYLDSCEGGDLHTTVAQLVWPEEPWTDEPLLNRELAEQPYYRHYSRRFMCKKLGHGSNYGGRPKTLADQTKTDVKLIEDFQPKYFKAFPAHVMWHAWVKEQVRSYGQLVSLSGRRRHFFGRRDSDDTIREAIAFDPQGSLADIVNHGMLRVWLERDCILLMQNHDAIVVEYPEKDEDKIVPKILEQLRYPVELKHGRQLVIPYGCQTGWNFGKYSETNIDGLKDYIPGDKRRRTPEVRIMDRSFRQLHR